LYADISLGTKLESSTDDATVLGDRTREGWDWSAMCWRSLLRIRVRRSSQVRSVLLCSH